MNPYKIKPGKCWNNSQKKRFGELSKAKDTIIAYWQSDEKGLPCNGGLGRIKPANSGIVHKISNPKRFVICSRYALHASPKPNLWNGSRIWIVALSGQLSTSDYTDKVAGTKREIIGELHENDVKQNDLLLSSLFKERVSFEEFENVSKLKINKTKYYNNCTFSNIGINFDNVFFINCKFINCENYFTECHFDNCSFDNKCYLGLNFSYFIDCNFPKHFKKKTYKTSAFIKM